MQCKSTRRIGIREHSSTSADSLLSSLVCEQSCVLQVAGGCCLLAAIASISEGGGCCVYQQLQAIQQGASAEQPRGISAGILDLAATSALECVACATSVVLVQPISACVALTDACSALSSGETWKESLQKRKPEVIEDLGCASIFQDCAVVHSQFVVYSADPQASHESERTRSADLDIAGLFHALRG